MPCDLSLDYQHIQSSISITYQDMQKVEDEYLLYFKQCFEHQHLK